MTTITLYSTTNPQRGLANDYQPILTSAGKVYIRAYVRSGPNNDLAAALDAADCGPDEIVLNTIEAPVQQPSASAKS